MITALTGLKVHSDGAHCKSCIPYDLNTRIVDMGRIFSTSNESEAVDLVRKYTTISPEDCRNVRDEFGSIVPDNACNSVNEAFVIVSRDLVGKYYWISYYGSFDYESMSGKHTSYVYLQFTGEDINGNSLYGDKGIDVIRIERRDGQVIPSFALPVEAIKTYNIGHINEIVFFDEQGDEKRLDLPDSTNETDTKKSLLWVSPNWKYIVIMTDDVKDSMLARLGFFGGRGLEHFQLVFENPTVKIYKVRI